MNSCIETKLYTHLYYLMTTEKVSVNTLLHPNVCLPDGTIVVQNEVFLKVLSH